MEKSIKFGSDQYLLKKVNSKEKLIAYLKNIWKELTPKMHMLNFRKKKQPKKPVKLMARKQINIL